MFLVNVADSFLGMNVSVMFDLLTRKRGVLGLCEISKEKEKCIDFCVSLILLCFTYTIFSAK